MSVNLFEILKNNFGFDKFKGNQEPIIQNVLDGNDTFVLMPTGGGKSLCYQMPSMMLEGTAIVISPLIALMKNQVDAMRSFSTDDGIAHFLNSSLNKTETQKVRDDVSSGRTKLLYVAPESLTKEENVEFLKSVTISFYAIDEAHCISEWGHDFRPEYRKIRPIINEIGRKPIIALTATATPKVQHDIQKNLNILDASVYKSSFNRTNLYYEIRPKTNATKEIIKYIKANTGKSGIIYCLSRKKVEELAEALQVNGIKALAYHAGMDSANRSKNQDMFLMEDVDVIVATIAFGMGIDKPDVRYVIHYDIPKSIEGYYQETGRAGRDGGEGKCITFYSYKDIQKLEKFIQGKPVAEQEIGKQLLLETATFAESAVCRRVTLLNYFGEELQEECNNCDNCLNPKKQFEGKEFMISVLDCIIESKQMFKSNEISDILTGQETSIIKTYKLDKISSFGTGTEKDKKFWNAIVRQGIIAKYIDKEIENYGLLKMTEKGMQYLEKPISIMLVEDHDYSENDSDNKMNQGLGSGGADPTLLKMLKELRKSISKRKEVPPFVVFQDPSLDDMAIQYPFTMDELVNIHGVSNGKAIKFGAEFIKLIKAYVEENNIERPLDLVVKSVVNKSGKKVYYIQSIDRKLSLSEIAEAKGLSFDELLKELEAIVYSGTKLDIQYYLDDVMDEDKQDDIYDYFLDSETDDIEDALDELDDDDYSDEDVRLIRIKFLSEMAN